MDVEEPIVLPVEREGEGEMIDRSRAEKILFGLISDGNRAEQDFFGPISKRE